MEDPPFVKCEPGIEEPHELEPTFHQVMVKDEPGFDQVRVKEEPGLHQVMVKDEPGFDLVRVKEEPTFHQVMVKEEPGFDLVRVKEELNVESAADDKVEDMQHQSPVDMYFMDFVKEEVSVDQAVVEDDPQPELDVDTVKKDTVEADHDYINGSSAFDVENLKQLATYLCYFCQGKFSSRSHLRRHLNWHTKKRVPFTCTICSETFRRRSNLLNHVLVHSTENMRSCSICEKSFTKQYHLKQHMITHSGERPYICAICGYGCRDKSKLNKHASIHTKK